MNVAHALEREQQFNQAGGNRRTTPTWPTLKPPVSTRSPTLNRDSKGQEEQSLRQESADPFIKRLTRAPDEDSDQAPPADLEISLPAITGTSTTRATNRLFNHKNA